MKYSLEVIPKPRDGTASVIQMKTNEKMPIFKGDGNDSYLCGTCSNVLALNVQRGRIINIVLVCPQCGAYNRVKGT